MAVLNCKVYKEGNHWVANIPCFVEKKEDHSRRKDEKFDKFKVFYKEAFEKRISKKKIFDYIKDRFWETVEDICNDIPTDEELEVFYKRHVGNVRKRLQRYNHKAALSEWNYFITLTYDSEKMSADEFENKVRRSLSNFATRHKWKYMLVWEYGKEGGRLHLHALCNIPDGEMVGALQIRKDYSTKRHKWEFRTENTYFAKRFGRNDFQRLSDKVDYQRAIDYLKKYITKNNEFLVYSRGIPDCVEMVVDTEKDVYCIYQNCCFKAILYDGLFMSKEDIDEFIADFEAVELGLELEEVRFPI